MRFAAGTEKARKASFRRDAKRAKIQFVMEILCKSGIGGQGENAENPTSTQPSRLQSFVTETIDGLGLEERNAEPADAYRQRVISELPDVDAVELSGWISNVLETQAALFECVDTAAFPQPLHAGPALRKQLFPLHDGAILTWQTTAMRLRIATDFAKPIEFNGRQLGDWQVVEISVARTPLVCVIGSHGRGLIVESISAMEGVAR